VVVLSWVTIQFFSSGLIMVGEMVREALVLTMGRDLPSAQTPPEERKRKRKRKKKKRNQEHSLMKRSHQHQHLHWR